MKTNSNRHESLAAFLILLAGTCWGLIGLFSGILSHYGCSPLQITMIRNLVAAAGLFLILLFRQPKALRIALKDIWMFLCTGILSIAFFNMMYFETMRQLNLSMAAILLYTGPFFVVIMSRIFFREKISRPKIFALILAFFGCMCTTGVLDMGRQPVSFYGIATGIASGFGYGLYSIFGRIALKKYSFLTISFYTFLVAGLSLLPFGIGSMELSPGLDGRVLSAMVAIGLISTLTPFLLYTSALAHVPAGKASLLTFSEPLVACLVGIVVFGDQVTGFTLLGTLLIFIALFCLYSVR